ncbi:MAG TPA: hypothetical protein VEZ47_04090 [Gemmatirosa sp.]|nr:hypothetical protein [Gemmatirosa sp.]
MLRLPPLARAGIASLLPLLAASCASSGAAADVGRSRTTLQTVAVDGGGTYDMNVFRSVRGDQFEVPATADAVFRVLPSAFTNVGLEANTIVAAERQIALIGGVMRRRLGKERLSRYLTCGEGATGTPNADEYEVRLTVGARVLPVTADSARSALSTTVTATARPMGRSSPPIDCATTGALEVRLAEEVRRLAAAR